MKSPLLRRLRRKLCVTEKPCLQKSRILSQRDKQGKQLTVRSAVMFFCSEIFTGWLPALRTDIAVWSPFCLCHRWRGRVYYLSELWIMSAHIYLGHFFYMIWCFTPFLPPSLTLYFICGSDTLNKVYLWMWTHVSLRPAAADGALNQNSRETWTPIWQQLLQPCLFCYSSLSLCEVFLRHH